MSLASALAGASLAAIAWIIIGYPLWLALRAARRPVVPRRLPPDDVLPTVTAVIPVHNGGRFLAAKLESILAANYPASRLDILVLSDGSTDETDEVAASFVARGRVRFVRLEKSGKAVALSTAFPMVTSAVVLLTDARQQLDPDCIRWLVGALADPAVGAVSGTLKIRSGLTAGEAGTGLYWRYESWIRRNLSRIDSVLGATGPIYAIRRPLARALPRGCILDDMWLPMQVVQAGHRAVLSEDAVAWDYPTSLDSEFNRKVRTQAGLYQLMRLDPRLVNPFANRLWWPFVTLKVGRLLLGHLLIVLAVATPFVVAPWALALGGAQLLFYGVFVLGRVLPEGSPLKRLTSPVVAFVTLVAAAFMAQSIFFRDPATLWKPTQVRLTDTRS